VDYEATVWLDGQQVGHHRGGHTPFEVDATSFVKKNHKVFIAVQVKDKVTDLTQPRGKQVSMLAFFCQGVNGMTHEDAFYASTQYWKPQSESIFYTPTTGLWQPVWFEWLPSKSRIVNAVLTPDIDRGTLTVDVDFADLEQLQSPTLQVSSRLGSFPIGKTQRLIPSGSDRSTITLSMALPGSSPPDELIESMNKPGSTILPTQITGDAWNEGIALWSPEHPFLYDIQLELLDLGENAKHTHIDSIMTYTGMRKIAVEDGQFKLNNRPYFQRLVLDQGYWPQSGMTAPDDKAFIRDITKMKELGFNGCRKHQKVEDPRFLFCADHLGFLVWGEMANAYEFSTSYMERFTQEWTEVIKRDINHPCIVAWVPVNESWAYTALPTSARQRDFLRAIYYLTKSLDPSRPCVDNDGWEHVISDLLTIHDYAPGEELRITAASKEKLVDRKAGKEVLLEGSGKEYTAGQPIILSEFGGVAIDLGRTHGAAGGSESWGYHTARSDIEFLSRLKSLVDAVIDGGIVQGFCYTQLADVEQEANGLLTADRQFKIDPVKIKEIIGRRSKFDP
jgi:hypothetical protein